MRSDFSLKKRWIVLNLPKREYFIKTKNKLPGTSVIREYISCFEIDVRAYSLLCAKAVRWVGGI